MIDAQSNLSKIKPKLRTQGRVSGNFGRNKVRAGSQLSDLGMTKSKNVSITSRGDYLKKIKAIYDNPPNKNMYEFSYKELHRLNYFQVKRLEKTGRTERPYRTPGAG